MNLLPNNNPTSPAAETPVAAEQTACAAAQWTAVCFALGDLSTQEATAFEATLADDQAAREDVAQAARLLQTLASVMEQERPRASVVIASDVIVPENRAIFLRGVLRFVMATAAAGLLGVLLWETRQGAVVPDAPASVASKAGDPAGLVALWSAAAEPSAAEPSAADESAAEESPDGEAALLPPDWLLAAVEYEAAGIGTIESGLGVPFARPDAALERN